MDKDTALDMALEVLEVANSLIDSYYLPKEKAWLPEIEAAIKAIKQARSAHVQEPVACDCNQGQVCHVCDPITPPTQRQWVGLTDEEKQEWIDAMPYNIEPRHCMILVNVMEAKLKAKNTV